MPIMFMTARSDEKIHRRTLALGARAFLLKPLDHDVLVDLFETILTERRKRRGRDCSRLCAVLLARNRLTVSGNGDALELYAFGGNSAEHHG